MQRFSKEELLERIVEDYCHDMDARRCARYFGITVVELKRRLSEPKARLHLVQRKIRLDTRLDVSVKRVLREKAKIAFANMRDFTILRNGSRYIDLRYVDDLDLAAVQELTTEEEIIDTGLNTGVIRTLRRTRIRLYDKNSALNDLMHHLGIYETSDSTLIDADYEVTMDLAASSSALTVGTP